MTILITFFVGVQLFLGACALVYLVGQSAANPAKLANRSRPAPLPESALAAATTPLGYGTREMVRSANSDQAVVWAHA
jgi:hypothetical protein